VTTLGGEEVYHENLNYSSTSNGDAEFEALYLEHMNSLLDDILFGIEDSLNSLLSAKQDDFIERCLL
jgi:hypothetical protein